MSDFIDDLKNQGIKELISLFKSSKGIVQGKIKNFIIDKVNSKKFLISMSGDDVINFERIEKSPSYRRMEDCLGSHWSMNLICLGLYVAELNKLDSDVLQIKVRAEVHSKYGSEGIKILNMGSTHAIDNIISYLSDVKIEKNYNYIQMGRLFDKIIQDWKDITIFVQTGETENNILIKISNMIASEKPIFMVFAYGSATYPTISAIASLNNQRAFSDKYIFSCKPEKRKIGDKEIRLAYNWFFTSVKDSDLEMFA